MKIAEGVCQQYFFLAKEAASEFANDLDIGSHSRY